MLRFTSSTLEPLDTHSTLCADRLGQRAAVCARPAWRLAQSVVARWPSVSVPCLQIRLARFDSGPRLQHTRITEPSVVRFFSCAHRCTLAAHFLQGSALAAGCCKGEGVFVHRAAGLGR